jgi:hypothetical protein
MSEAEDDLICRRCGRVVRVSAAHYETFEKMHWVCFHYEFEHDNRGQGVDPDEDCGIPGCPSGPGPTGAAGRG